MEGVAVPYKGNPQSYPDRRMVKIKKCWIVTSFIEMIGYSIVNVPSSLMT